MARTKNQTAACEEVKLAKISSNLEEIVEEFKKQLAFATEEMRKSMLVFQVSIQTQLSAVMEIVQEQMLQPSILEEAHRKPIKVSGPNKRQIFEIIKEIEKPLEKGPVCAEDVSKEKPNEGAIVKLKLTGKLQDGTTFSKKGYAEGDELFEFKTVEEQAIEGLDRAVTTTKKGEVSILTLFSDGTAEAGFLRGDQRLVWDRGRREINGFGQLRHPNLMRVLGYCLVEDEKLLEYKHLTNGTLSSTLRRDGTLLDWPTLFRMVLVAARGLAWLHHGCRPPILHQNISSNMFLPDEDFDAQIMLFGLARLKLLSEVELNCKLVDFGNAHVSARIKTKFWQYNPWGQGLEKGGGNVMTRDLIGVWVRKKNKEVTEAIQEVVGAHDCKIVEGVLSHQMKQFVIDGNKVMLNVSSPDTRVDEAEFQVVVGFSSGVFGLYQMTGVVCIHLLSISREKITTASFNGLGNWLTFGCAKLGQLLVWEWKSEIYIFKRQGHYFDVNCIAYSRVSQWLATGADGDRIKVWTVSSGFCFVTFSERTNDGTALHFMAKPMEVQLYEEDEIAVVEFNENLPLGVGVLKMEFVGILNVRMKGFYRSTYQHNGEKNNKAVTQFEPAAASRCFPCWDEPAWKATFKITLEVPSVLVALSNMPVIEEIKNGNLKTVYYQESPVISTYLVAVVAGPFDYLEDRTPDGIIPRMYCQFGKADQGKFALIVAVKTLGIFKEYFSVPYPLPKLDLIAIPDFAGEAMKNYGLVSYRETTLLYDDKTFVAANKQTVAIVVAHELAHQRFGNLVTMEWCTHLCLNEGFATWVSYLAIDSVFPDWQIWTQFFDETIEGLGLDGLAESHPIEVDINHAGEINEIFDAISYMKGASVIWMLQSYHGPECFQLGLASYIKRYACSNARTEDIWSVLEEESGECVLNIMSTWNKQQGYPVVKVEIKDQSLGFEQSQFLRSGPQSVGRYVEDVGGEDSEDYKLEKVNEEASEKVLEVEQKYNEVHKRVYDKRNEIIKSTPNFGLTLFMSHPFLGELVTEEDQKIFKYLANIEVEECKGVKSGSAITFRFNSNPYFEDLNITKIFSFLEEGTTKIAATPMKRKESIGIPNIISNEKGKKKRSHEEESFFSWFTGFEYKGVIYDVRDQVAEIIKDELWSNPLAFFYNDGLIDEILLVLGAGRTQGLTDAANLLNPMEGTTILDEYRKHVEEDAAFKRCFPQVYVAEIRNELETALTYGQDVAVMFKDTQTRQKLSAGKVKLATSHFGNDGQELIHGMIRMWKAMLKCHQTQFRVVMGSKMQKLRAIVSIETQSSTRALTKLERQLHWWTQHFNDWIVCQKSYIGP